MKFLEHFKEHLKNKRVEFTIPKELINIFDVDLVYRLVPLSELPILESKLTICQPFKVYVLKNGPLQELFHSDTNRRFYTMYLLQNSYNSKEISIELCFLDDLVNDESLNLLNNCFSNVYVDISIINFFHCELGTRIILKQLKNPFEVSEIEVHHGKNIESKDVLQELKLFLALSDSEPQVLNANFPINIGKNICCCLKFPPNFNSSCVLDGNNLRNCSYSFCFEDIKPLENVLKDTEEQNFFQSLACVEIVFKNILACIWKNDSFQSENVLICGKTGMGKSSILKHTIRILNKYPYFVYTQIVQCKAIKGKTVDSLHKIFTDIFSKLILCQPSILIVDDLQVLCENCEGEDTPNTVNFNRVSEMLQSLLNSISKENGISIVASTDSVAKLNRHIYKSRGNHLFKNIVSIDNLTKADRVALLKYFFEKSPTKDLDYSSLANKSDGFVIQDIKDFYEKALFESFKEFPIEEKPLIEQNHCDIALKKTCSLSLQNVKFHSAGDKSFEDIGGLSEVKNILTQSFLWPVKYSSIFQNAPIRLQTGLLLYGPPGTGKTLLAGAAAKQCGLRLISVKGPELLSKYIGASEQAVRDVFEKAQSAKPCILFFDEFDSLAPRRGHDNTGVTDRVVNQLLTQLDGVESLTGVCVLAATSRPDLLDPALLRPGRLDRQMMCPMPDKDERQDILRILSRRLELAPDADLAQIAIKTEGYSGADLQSLLYTAHISSLKIVNNEEIIADKSIISQNILLDALSKTRPSLIKSEREKYNRIYERFQGGSTEEDIKGLKVTLA
ncbi:peroxisome biogenesis factor 1 isoform X2 [Sitophilus oryzae]|nr:peroxisome biogenesis factor 1 isoform X2 [Sitophilus oryzae]